MLALPTALRAALADGGATLSVLLVRLSAMGDVLRTLPALAALRAALPAARLRWAVDARWTVVLDGHPALDGLVPFPRREFDTDRRTPAGWLRLPGRVLSLRRDLRADRPDLVIDFHGNLRAGVVTWLSGAPHRLGYDGHQQKEGNRLFLTLRHPAGERRVSRVRRNLALVAALGVPTDPDADCRLALPERGREEADAARRTIGGAPYAIVAPGASRAQAFKKPPRPVLIACCEALRRAGVRAAVQYGPGEEDEARALVEASAGAAVLCPPTSLPALADLLRGATLFLGGDSGPLHLACAVRCPVVALYGPTDPVVNAPWGVAHRVVAPHGRIYTGIKREDRRLGFDGLREEHAVAAIESLLRELRS